MEVGEMRNFPAEDAGRRMWFSGSVWLKIIFWIIMIIYITIPVMLWLHPWIASAVVFSNFIYWPLQPRLDNPTDYGLVGAQNFYILSMSDTKIGVWHILPQSLALDSFKNEEAYEATLKSGKPIILYLHGNMGNRGTSHRVQLYKIFSSLNYHTLVLDYRGFGDSLGYPSEAGVVEDARILHNWIRKKSDRTPVFVWGHSLGSGIATELLKQLQKEQKEVKGLVLEAAFTNLYDLISNHPLSFPYRQIPNYLKMLEELLLKNELSFANDDHIQNITIPILLLHAEDDYVVPYMHGLQLYHAAVQKRSACSGKVNFQGFDSSLGCGHKYICAAPNISQIIEKFVKDAQNYISDKKYLNCGT